MKKTAVVLCPGRGTYNKSELGYLHRLHADKTAFLDMADAQRARLHLPGVRKLDGRETYAASVHSRGDNASPLIFACSYADFLSIDRDAIDIVAVTGNSMGWYTALACGGALDAANGFALVDTMGRLMHEASIGGQLIHTTLDENWQNVPGRDEELRARIAAIHGHDGAQLYVSIELGGMLVVAGNERGLAEFVRQTPAGPGRFPLSLQNHAAFHTPLQAPVMDEARRSLPQDWFVQPRLPLIDGAGRIWRPHMTDTAALWDYTLGAQIVEPYDFTRAVQVALREFAPDCLILLGPGDTLGGAVAQSMLACAWHGLRSKDDFVQTQARTPFLVSMGRDDQRQAVVRVPELLPA
jgi:[acyl-carrier-protein] S-malonyltransferase